MTTKESLQEDQYYFPYHHLTHVHDGAVFTFRHLFWGLEHYSDLSFLIEKIKKENFTSLIDVGCGEGRILFELEKILPSKKLTGIDISERAIYFAKGFTKFANVVVHDITKSPILTPHDIAVSCEVIEHIPPNQINSYIRNIAESLTPTGQLLLTTPTTNLPVNRKHYQHFTLPILKDYLSPHFEIVEVVYLNRIGMLGRILERSIANRFFLSNNRYFNQIITRLYNHYVLPAKEADGAHIFIRASKIRA